jgi:hypothetical protein
MNAAHAEKTIELLIINKVYNLNFITSLIHILINNLNIQLPDLNHSSKPDLYRETTFIIELPLFTDAECEYYKKREGNRPGISW